MVGRDARARSDAAQGIIPMATERSNDSAKRQIRYLRELIEALDRRVPMIERVGEAKIAKEAAALKDKALKRLAELEG